MKANRFRFRAWSKDLKLMAYDVQNEYDTINGVRFTDGTEPGESSFFSYLQDEDYVVMQSTGLLDNTKDGKEIFEGDVVKCRMNFENKSLPHMGEVVYMNEFGAFATKNQAGETLLHHHMLNTFEIIGNKFENPDLLTRLNPV